MTAQEYLDSLPMFQWLSFSQVPDELQYEVFLLIDLNQFEEYRVGLNEIHSNLFMKTRRSERAHIMDVLKELERNIAAVEWVYVDTGEGNYLVTLYKGGLVRNVDNSVVNRIFLPDTHIFEYYEWITLHAKMVKLKYKQSKKYDTKSEEAEDTGPIS